MKTNLSISEEPLQLQACIDWVRDDEAGGIDIFIGTVRSRTDKKKCCAWSSNVMNGWL
jgi:molybdopterin synthase catalytic subunit